MSSRNVGNGIEIVGAMATGNEIFDNYIGSAIEGSPTWAMQARILIRDKEHDSIGRTTNNGNVIAFNGDQLGHKG